MSELRIQNVVVEAGQVCISKNALSTLSRAFSVAKPIVSIQFKGEPDSSDTWVASVVMEGCVWPRVVYAKVDLLSYLLEKQPTISLLDILGESTEDDKYVHSFLQDLRQPFPVYPKIESHVKSVYTYFAERLVNNYIFAYPRQIIKAGNYSMYVRLDLLSLDELKVVVKRAPKGVNAKIEEGTSTTCLLEGDGTKTTIIDNPSISFLKDISSNDDTVWSYIDHETQHLAGRVVETRIG